MLGQAGVELVASCCLILALEDLRSRSNHLRECPVGDAFAVGEAAATVPPGQVGKPVEVLEELPREPRLADACDSRHLHELRARLRRRRVKELLDEPKLAVAADERRLEALAPECPADRGGDADRTP